MPRDNTRKVSHVITQESINIRDELRDAQLEWQKGFMFKTLGAVFIMIVILGVLLFGTNYYIQDYSGLSKFAIYLVNKIHTLYLFYLHISLQF